MPLGAATDVAPMPLGAAGTAESLRCGRRDQSRHGVAVLGMNERVHRPRPLDLPADFADLPRLLSVAAVCGALDVRERSVRRWIADGRLLCVRAGTRVRVLRADLIAFLREGTPR